jgi:hypothetical protein
MGLNAYFTYQVVGYHGAGSVSYRLALTAVFIEGFIFVFLSLIGIRQWLVKVIPASIKVASGVGIGLFLTEIGMSYAGIGLISGSPVTPTNIAGCPPRYLNPETGACDSHKMTNPTVCLALSLKADRAWNCIMLTRGTLALDRCHLWRALDCISHGLQSQISYHNWHHDSLNHVLAVSLRPPHVLLSSPHS